MGRFEAFIGVNFWTSLFVLFNTITVYVVAKKYLFQPVTEIILKRQQELDEIYAAADEANRTAESLRAEYRQKLSQAEFASRQMLQEAETRSRDREAEILRAARQNASGILEKANADIAREKKKALRDAQQALSGLALSMASKALGRILNEQEQRALTDQFIEELGGTV